MKKFLLPLFVAISVFAFGQGNPMPNYQQFGSPVTLTDIKGAAKGGKGVIIGRYADTLTANNNALSNYIKFYPGAFILTDNPRDVLWQRNYNATKWIKPANISSLNFYTDSSIIICYNDGHCDTIATFNFTNIITNIIQNFLDTTIINNNGDSNVYVYNDSFLVVCNGAGACDTISFGDAINNFYFLNDSTIVICDTPQVIQIGDSSIVQQLCDTINVPRAARLILQNGVQFVAPGIGEHGHTSPDPNPSQLQKDTYLYTDFYNYGVSGAPYQRPTFSVQNKQWTQISSSVTSFNSLGGNPYQFTTEPDVNNPVNLYVNYIDRIIEGNGVFTGDTIGFMYDRIGYALMTNAQGIRAGYHIQSPLAKQSGIMFHTFDTQYTDAVTIFANQTPNPYLFSVSPFPTTTLLDSRIATFRTNKDITFQGYPDTRDDGPTNVVLYPDEDGNLLVGGVQGGSTINILNDTTLLICSNNRGNFSCDTVRITNITNPTTINVFNDTTIIICNEAGSCDTITVNNYNILGQMVNIANTVFVAKSGNDATGVRQRLDLPFFTIKAALAAAFTGDVIVVFPGTYEETNPLNLAKSVNYHFIGKGDLRLTTSVGSGSIFTDSATISYSKIWGEHWTFTARSNQRVLNQTAASTVELVADSIISASGITINQAGGARTTVTANYLFSNANAGGLWLTDSSTFVGNINQIEQDQFGIAVWIENMTSVVLHSQKIFSNNPLHDDYLIRIADSNPTDSIYIDANEIYSQREWAIWARGASPNMYISAQRISAKSDCVVTSTTDFGTNGMLTVDADVIENRITTTMDGIIHGEDGGNLTVLNAKLIRQSGVTGADILTTNFGTGDGHVYINGVVYDQTKVTEAAPGTIKRVDSLYYGSQFRMNEARFEFDSTNIVAANDLNLTKGNIHIVSGNTTINAIFTQGWQPGSFVLLEFTGTPTVKDGTSGGAGTAQIQLAGNTDFVAAAGDVLTLEYNGTYWREAARSLAATSSGLLFARTDAINNSGGAMYFDGNVQSMTWDNATAFQFSGTSFAYSDYSTVQPRIAASSTVTELYSPNGNNALRLSNTFNEWLVQDSSIFLNATGSSVSNITIDDDGTISLSAPNGIFAGSIPYNDGVNVVGVVIDTLTGRLYRKTLSGLITADNGLTMSTATNVQLGATAAGANSPLLHDTYLNGSTFKIIASSTVGSGSAFFQIENTNANGYGLSVSVPNDANNAAILATSVSSNAIIASTTNGIGLQVTSTNYLPIFSSTTSGYNRFDVNPSSTNTVVPIMLLNRFSTGTPAAGMGASIEFDLESTTTSQLANQIISKWLIATDATRTSQLDITGVTGAATETWLTLGQSGYVKLRPMTVTEAGAIATAEGLIVFVSNTDATFTSVGIWIYQNGAWKAL